MGEMAPNDGMQPTQPKSTLDAESALKSKSAPSPALLDPALAIVTSQTAWITADNKERISSAKREAAAVGKDHALVRDVRGITGDQKPFAERKIQFLTPGEAGIVREFLSSNPDFPEALLKDHTALLGEYPHTKPIDGTFTGWLAQKIEFNIVVIASRKE